MSVAAESSWSGTVTNLIKSRVVPGCRPLLVANIATGHKKAFPAPVITYAERTPVVLSILLPLPRNASANGYVMHCERLDG